MAQSWRGEENYNSNSVYVLPTYYVEARFPENFISIDVICLISPTYIGAKILNFAGFVYFSLKKTKPGIGQKFKFVAPM